jgi:hypothetical protein
MNSKQLQEAIEARNKFLEDHPHLKRYQDEIDHVMDGVGENPAIRMETLSIMMATKLLEQSAEFQKIKTILNKASLNGE